MANTNRNKPNIVFILTDDQGYWALGCNGNDEILTPNIDNLAEEGVRFENFYCASPVCSPARASLLTGRIPSQHGVHDWIRGGNVGNDRIEYLEGIKGYTDYLAENGYTCALSGKWHLGANECPQKGFTYWYSHQRGGGDYYNAPMVKDGVLMNEPIYVTDAITENALDFMGKMSSECNPFYLSIHYTAPHSPWLNCHPKQLTDLYKDCEFHSCKAHPRHPDMIISTAPDVHQEESFRDPRSSLIGYYASITGVDNSVGKIINKLEELGELENTVIVFTSDNGFNCGQHGIWGKGNGTFPQNMYDTSIKVPMIMRHPAGMKQGAVVKQLVSAYDFMPTLLDYVGIPCENTESLPGRSFKSCISRNAAELTGTADDFVVVFDEYGPVRMIRTKEYKYVFRYPFGPDEFYDLIKDPEEEFNQFSNPFYKDIIVSMRNQLGVWFKKYVCYDVDGVRERVWGNGQVKKAGIHSKGEKAFIENCIVEKYN